MKYMEKGEKSISDVKGDSMYILFKNDPLD